MIVSPTRVAGRTAFTQGSPPPEFVLGTGVNVTPAGGNAGKVLVGAGVFVIVAVGGVVAVGMAASVSAIIVRATAAAVLCRASTSTVGGGVACAPHALVLSAIRIIRVRI